MNIPRFLDVFPYRKYRVTGKSMEPTVKDGATVIVTRFFRPKCNDVIALQHPTKHHVLIKRIQEVSNGRFRVLGDNNTESTDSRHFGLVKRNAILGKVVAVF